MIVEFLVEQDRQDWVIFCADRELARHTRESAALREANGLARDAYREGHDARVLTFGREGRPHVECSYGRHPLVVPGRERARAAFVGT